MAEDLFMTGVVAVPTVTAMVVVSGGGVVIWGRSFAFRVWVVIVVVTLSHGTLAFLEPSRDVENILEFVVSPLYPGGV
jgi:hypothetical protein